MDGRCMDRRRRSAWIGGEGVHGSMMRGVHG
jgi:hypothetical protein